MDTAALSAHVGSGKHVEGVAARVIAFALEHALVPFTTPLRPRKATACYWCVCKSHYNDGMRFSLQALGDVLLWMNKSEVCRVDWQQSKYAWYGTLVQDHGCRWSIV